MTTKADTVIITLLDSYIPGYKAGGPIRSIANLVAELGDEFCFKILTPNRDLGDTHPYPGIIRDEWVRVGKADVMYLSSGWSGIFRLITLLCALDSKSVLYLNSFFSKRFSILAIFLRWLGTCKAKRVVLAPRGEFSQGALGLKRIRKHLYIKVSSWLGFYRGVVWHASTNLEESDIRNALPNLFSVNNVDVQADGGRMRASRTSEGIAMPGIVVVARDISHIQARAERRAQRKRSGQLRAVFVSRISPMKNLLYALETLKGVSGDVFFDIYGPLEDTEYWNKCKGAIDALPPNVRVKYRGMVEHERLMQVFAEHDLFLFPTLGENYGHVICEALSAGCPVLISDQTPWRGLQESGVGWDIPLGEPELFRAVLQQCTDADEEMYATFVDRAFEYAKAAASDPAIIEDNRRLFKYAMVG